MRPVTLASLLTTFIGCSSAAFAGDWGAAKYAGEFLSVGVGARALAMGGAHVALASDVTSGYWNPAGLTSLDYPQIAAMHSERFAGVVNYDYVGLAVPLGQRSTVALSVIRTGVDDIPWTALRNPDLALGYNDENGVWVLNAPYVSKMVSDAEWGWYFSYASKRSEKLSYGASAKFVRKGVGEYSAWGLGFDVAVRWNPTGHLLLGANLQDATSTLLAWDTGKRELILPTLKWGLALPIATPWLGGRITPVMDVDVKFEGRETAAQLSLGPGSADLHLGLEYEFRRLIALRVGLDVDHPSAGFGVHLPKLDVDYAFLSHSQLGDTHRVSLRLTIEEAKFARP